MSTALERTLYTARLERKVCLSESAQCYHLEFVVTSDEGNASDFPFTAGQFVSMVTTDPSGKEQTRAYSIASANNGNRSGDILDLCVNRTNGGFFSNYLVDLPVGSTVAMHGPYGYFILKQPVTDSILISTGTGIAPIRGFLQWLFPENGPNVGPNTNLDRSEGKQIWCVYGTRHESTTFPRSAALTIAGTASAATSRSTSPISSKSAPPNSDKHSHSLPLIPPSAPPISNSTSTPTSAASAT
jgi:hypothetical protein